MSARTLVKSGRIPWARGLAPAASRVWGGVPRRVGAVLTGLVLLGSGCAMKPQTLAASPAAVSKEHREVAELEKLIADRKAGIRSGGEERLTTSPAAESAGASGASSPRCDNVCRAGQEICTASRRICKIAAQLSETAVTASCQRAERSCTDAGALCAQCR